MFFLTHSKKNIDHKKMIIVILDPPQKKCLSPLPKRILDQEKKKKNCIGATICIGWEIQCLPYAGFWCYCILVIGFCNPNLGAYHKEPLFIMFPWVFCDIKQWYTESFVAVYNLLFIAFLLCETYCAYLGHQTEKKPCHTGCMQTALPLCGRACASSGDLT